MLRRLLSSALLAGAAGGAVAAALHLGFVQPVLLAAEAYEAGPHLHAAAETGLGQGAARDALTVLFMLLLHSGYALILVALMALAERQGARISGRAGLVWGLAGFAAVQLAPAFSLPPAVPGAATGELLARQVWWLAATGSAALAFWLVAFGRSVAAWGVAAALLLAPHLAGAPQPLASAGTAPPELAALFAARALGAGAAAWAVLGWAAGRLLQREGGPAAAAGMA